MNLTPVIINSQLWIVDLAEHRGYRITQGRSLKGVSGLSEVGLPIDGLDRLRCRLVLRWAIVKHKGNSFFRVYLLRGGVGGSNSWRRSFFWNHGAYCNWSFVVQALVENYPAMGSRPLGSEGFCQSELGLVLLWTCYYGRIFLCVRADWFKF
jgi:hypothetical protein